MSLDERLDHLFSELQHQTWDLLVLTETWREAVSECWTTEHGHMWFGSGGTRVARGVGLVLHSRWSYSAFKPVSDRLCYLDVELNDTTTVRIHGV